MSIEAAKAAKGMMCIEFHATNIESQNLFRFEASLLTGKIKALISVFGSIKRDCQELVPLMKKI